MAIAECTTDQPSSADSPAGSTFHENLDSRHLTVGDWRPTPRWPQHNQPTARPSLRLQGRWLDRAGFAIGANVHVLVTPRRLVVEVVESESAPELAESRKRRARRRRAQADGSTRG